MWPSNHTHTQHHHKLSLDLCSAYESIMACTSTCIFKKEEEPQPVEIEKKEEEHVEEVVEIESKEEETVEEDGFIDSQSLAWNVCEL